MIATILRFQGLDLIAGLTYDDTSYAASGKTILLEGNGSWGDSYRALSALVTAFYHWARGMSVENIAWTFATFRALGEFFLICAAARLYPGLVYAPAMVFLVSEASFIGASYGRQHLSSLLFSIPFTIWLYTWFLEKRKMWLWIVTAAGTGIIMLSHYCVLPVLCVMLLLECYRQYQVHGQWKRSLLYGVVALWVSVCVLGAIGKFSYGYANWLSYLVKLWEIIVSNQRTPHFKWSDAFMTNFASWEGVLFAIYVVALIWWMNRGLKSGMQSGIFPLAWAAALGLLMMMVRWNMGFMSMPRIYVFALPLLWLASAGWMGKLFEGMLAAWNERWRPMALAGVLLLALFIGGSHHLSFLKWPTANAAVGRYVAKNPTQKMSMFAGQPFFGEFLFGWEYCGILRTPEDNKNMWSTFKSRPRQISPENWAIKDEIYLANPNLAKYCDIIIVEHPHPGLIKELDEKAAQWAPQYYATNFPDLAYENPPIYGKNDGDVGNPSDLDMRSPLPVVRLYDLRGSPQDLKR